ncbi:transporter [Mesonia mobilis]|nr:transporter [Mesonia mobilis]MBQ0738581.1 transporter [Aquimarina celericrescens]
MKMKNFLAAGLLLTGQFLFAQYTETINSNRPGRSQGAFSVGNGVLQGEAGLRAGRDNHDLLNTETTLWGLDYEVRYGFLVERLEANLSGSFLNANQRYIVGASNVESTYRNFESNTLGLKYLVFDPHRKRVLEGPNLYSWKADNTFQLRDLIPAVSVYAGLNLLFGSADNPFIAPENDGITPQVAIITQHNLGRWVFVMNFIGDKFSTDVPSYSGIFTLTHAYTRELSFFAEAQIIKSDFYSDDIARLGAAYLFNDDFQVDISGLVNFRDTPSRWQVALGVSYRIDMHNTDEYIMEDKKEKKELNKKKEELKEDREDGFEDEVIE